jgi:hypothetical protein
MSEDLGKIYHECWNRAAFHSYSTWSKFRRYDLVHVGLN